MLTSRELEKLMTDTKFLSEVKRAALNHKDDPVPYASPELFQAQMWTLGLLDTFIARGYTIAIDTESIEKDLLEARKKQGW